MKPGSGVNANRDGSARARRGERAPAADVEKPARITGGAVAAGG
jgi:hypothetical protein